MLLAGLEAAAAIRLRIQRRDTPLSKEALLSAASERAGLSDFGTGDFEEGLDALLRSCNQEADLTRLGRYAVREECIRILVNRLELTNRWKERAALHATPVERPIFIVGMPRTGSTFLHGLLGSVPGLRAPRLREMLHPTAVGADAPRDAQARLTDAWLKVLNLQLAGIHEIEMDAPEECTFLMQHAFTSFVFGVALRVPSYLLWLARRDMTDAYRLHRRLLEHLGRTGTAERWVLKSPAHTLSLRTLMDTYPDARIIHLHRPMTDVVGSFCNLRETLLRMTSRSVSPLGIGAASLMTLRVAAARSIEARAEMDGRPVMDLRFEEVVAAPLQVLERICAFLGLEDSGPARRSAERFLERRRPRRGRRYRVERFGLDAAAIARHFEPYHEWSARMTAGAA